MKKERGIIFAAALLPLLLAVVLFLWLYPGSEAQFKQALRKNGYYPGEVEVIYTYRMGENGECRVIAERREGEYSRAAIFQSPPSKHGRWELMQTDFETVYEGVRQLSWVEFYDTWGIGGGSGQISHRLVVGHNGTKRVYPFNDQLPENTTALILQATHSYCILVTSIEDPSAPGFKSPALDFPIEEILIEQGVFKE